MHTIASALFVGIVLTVPLAHSTPGTALLAWAPETGDDPAAIPLYEVYGISEGTPTYLGSTELTAFVAPTFPSYLVKFRLPSGEGEVPNVCVVYHPDGPEVSLEIDCP
jgi:hypothetical protein